MIVRKTVILLVMIIVIISCGLLFALSTTNDPITSEPPIEVAIAGQSYKVKKPLTSTEDVVLIHTGTGSPTDNLDVDKEQALLRSITTQDDITSLLNYLHLSFKSWGIEDGRGYRALLKNDNREAWDSILSKRWSKSALYSRLAEVVDNAKVAKDFLHLAKLAEIAHAKNNPTAILYMHQIIHDLDKSVYGNVQLHEKVNRFGVTYAEDSESVTEVEQFIKDNLSS